jgi:hypothetical protein
MEHHIPSPPEIILPHPELPTRIERIATMKLINTSDDDMFNFE